MEKNSPLLKHCSEWACMYIVK